MKIFGVKVAFLATQSGLTRWIDFNSNKAYDAEYEIKITGNSNDYYNV